MNPVRYHSARALVIAVILAAVRADAANPLNLTPGTPATVTLGQVANLSAFNTSTGSADISYSNSDLATRTYVVRLPAGFDANNPSKKYGLITYIDAGSPHSFPTTYASALDDHDIIWLAGNGIDNAQSVNLRRGVAIMGAFRMTELYPVDATRTYASGLSGGGRTACDMAWLRSDYFHGFIGRVGSSLPGIIPGWECAGTNSTNADADYEFMAVASTLPSLVLPTHFRTALMSQYADFRRAENIAIYRYGHLNQGNIARAIVRPGGHSDEIGPSFTDAVDFLYHPLVDIIWDRFEDGNLAANVQPGKTVAGNGFSILSGSAGETTYAYNSVNHGVLKLAGNAAVVRANDTFTWQNKYGILIDARLRSQNATTAGQNEQIGLHIVPEASGAAAATLPGFHVYWCYGQPCRTEVVATDGTRKALASWEHTATHPMNLAATDKTFWSDSAAPDYAGRSKSFRGEDMHIALNSTGFQLTFNRPAANLSTTYPEVTLVSSDNSTPYAEDIPVILQGLWSEVETALVNALPAGSYKLVLTNDAIIEGMPVGDAVVDEIRLIGAAGPQAAPATLSATAPSNGQRTLTWSKIHGATAYQIQRSTSPDDGFTNLASASNTASTYTDTTAANSGAYYYRVAAIGSDSVPGNWSAVAFAARTGSAPSAPTSPAVTYPAAYQVRLAWTDVANNETAYRVERSPAGLARWSLVTGSLPAGTTSFSDTTVMAGTSYDYRISAVGTAGISGYASITANVPDVPPPTPAGLAATPTYASVDLSWEAVAQAGSYRVKRSDSPGGPYDTVGSGIAGTTFSDTTFTPGAIHYYVVSSVSGSGLLESPDSAEISVATLLLLPPEGLAVTPGFTTNVLNWSAATGATSYVVERGSDPAGPFNVIATVMDGTSFSDTGLVTGSPYYYVLRSASGAVQSVASSPVGGVPIPGTVTKANNTTALDQGASWSNGLVPTPLDTARWDGTYSSGVVGIGAGLSANGLQIASPSTSVTVTAGTGPLVLGAGGIDMSAGANSLSINSPVVLAASQSWNVGSGRNLYLNAEVSDAGAGRGLTIAGTGGIVLAADNTYSGPTTLAAGTLDLGETSGSTSGRPGTGPLTITGGLLRSNRTGPHEPFGGSLTASAGTLQVYQASGVLTLNSTNLPSGSNNAITTITGVSGASLVVDAAPGAGLTFGSNAAGFNLVIRNGEVIYNANSGSTDATNVRIEGGHFSISASAARYQLAAANQTFQLTGGTMDASKVTTYGFRVGGSNSATQTGAQIVTATQTGGDLLATTFSLGGNDTTAAKCPSYSLSGGNFLLNNTGTTAFTIGADTAGLGTSTFTLAGGRLVVPGTITGGQAGAKQILIFTGGMLTAGAINFTNLRSSPADTSNGTLVQSGGILAPGDAGTAGRTVLTGNYQLGATASLAIDIGGNVQATGFQTGQYDCLTVSGATTLSGGLAVNLVNGFAPSNNTAFTILSSTGTLSGAFANVSFGQRVATTGGEGSFLVTQAGNTGVLSDYQPALTPVESWRQLYFLTTGNAGNAADGFDGDGDGLVNLLEYALGGNPVSATDAPRPTLTNDGAVLHFSFVRARSDIDYTVESSADLQVWQTQASGPGTVGQTTTVDVPATASQRFLRLRVSLAP